LLPYFVDYVMGMRSLSPRLMYPDGRGRYWQPPQLIRAFDIMATEYDAIEKRKEKENPSDVK